MFSAVSCINNRKDMSIFVPVISCSLDVSHYLQERCQHYMPVCQLHHHYSLSLLSTLCLWSHSLRFQMLHPDEYGSCSTFVSGSLMHCVCVIVHSRKPLDVLVRFYLATFSCFHLVVSQSCLPNDSVRKKERPRDKNHKTKVVRKEKHTNTEYLHFGYGKCFENFTVENFKLWRYHDRLLFMALVAENKNDDINYFNFVDSVVFVIQTIINLFWLKNMLNV